MNTNGNFHSEAVKFLIGDIGFTMPEWYGVFLIIASIVLGLAAFVLVLFAAISIKRSRPLGIFMALVYPIGFVTAALAFISYADIDFSCFALTYYGISQLDAWGNLVEGLGRYFMSDMMPQFIFYVLSWIGYQLVTILAIVYFIKLLKAPKGKALAALALIVMIIRLLFVGPIEIISLLFGANYFEIQAIWNGIFNLVFFLPILLLVLQAFVNIVYNIKQKKKKKKSKTESDAEEEVAQEAEDESVAENSNEAYVPAEETAAPAEETNVSEEKNENANADDKEPSSYCLNCGYKREEKMMFCPECGQKF